MPRHYTREKYDALAASKNLKFIGETVPLATTSTKWQCLRCGTVWTKSFGSVSNSPNGCRCTSPLTHTEDKYVALAKRWNLVWTPGDLKPKNTKTVTRWLLPSGLVLECAYYDLAYEGKMPNSVKEALGLPTRKRGGAVNV